MAYETFFGPSSGPGESDFSPRSSLAETSFDHRLGGFRRDGYGQSNYDYEQQQSSGPKPKTVIKLSMQPRTGRWYASLKGGTHVYNGNSLDELAKAMASIGGRGFLEMDTVDFDYQGNPVSIVGDGSHEYGSRHFNNLPELVIVPGLSYVRSGGGRKKAIRGTERAQSSYADELAERITEYRLKAIQEHAAKAERTRIASNENNRKAAERNAQIWFDRPKIHEERTPVRSRGYTSWRNDSFP